jgi:polyhydroxybutyrate depolymerase
VYLAGHSDGGTTAAAVAFLGKSALAPRAIVASAAGIREQDLDRYACPSPVSVMVVHSRQDQLFPLPAYGKDAARWWAACGRCRQEPSAPDADGCVRYDGCDPGVQVRYCETSGPHASWPAINSALLAFLSAAPYTQRKGAENAQTSELPGPSPGSR